MSLKCGIVGLPNIGKSTLFNAITNTLQAEAANYPFCTIEPNFARVLLEDERLIKLSKLAGSIQITPNFLELVDIAGLVKGASSGAGLGNKFLSHIREVDAILHLVRCFEDENIIHVENKVDPVSDIDTINVELILADLESASSIRAKNSRKFSKEEDSCLERLIKSLNELKPVKRFLEDATNDEKLFLKTYNFITAKPVIYVANVDEGSIKTGNEFSNRVKQYASTVEAEFEIISVKIESEISSLASEEEKNSFLEMLELKESGLLRTAKCVFNILNLITYFTVGPKETRAWTISKGTKAPVAAGVIHSDFEKGFIRAEIISYSDYIKYQGEAGSSAAGKMRVEGKEYIMEDGDIAHFRFNV